MFSGAAAQEYWIGKPDRIASALAIMLEGPIGAAAFNNEFGRPNLAGYFRTYEQAVARRSARLSQADHDRGRHRQHSRRAHAQASAAGRNAAHPAGRPRHADRHGRRRRVVDGDRRQHRGPRFRFGPARQRGDRAARAGSDRSLLAARQRQSDSVGARRRRGRAVQRAAGARAWRRRGRHVRFARDPVRGIGHVAARDLVQRGAGTLRPRHRARGVAGIRRHLRARALPVCRGRHGECARATGRDRPALRQQAGGRSARRDPGQAAEDDARRAPRVARVAAARSCRSRRSRTPSIACCNCRRWPTRRSS